MTIPYTGPVKDHCWHADEESPEHYDPWPARTGRQGVKCCSCPASGHRPIELTPLKYDGFHSQVMPVYGTVTQTTGAESCSGADLRDEKHATLFVNAIGYLVSILVVLVVATVMPDTFVALFHLPHVWWLMALWIFAYMAAGYLRHGHAELRRLNEALQVNRNTVVAFRQFKLGAPIDILSSSHLTFGKPTQLNVPSFDVTCPSCRGMMTTATAASVQRESDYYWRYTGVKCTGCTDTWTVLAVDHAPDFTISKT